MDFISTRDTTRKAYTSAQVIKMGLAPDGGLFVPAQIPHLTQDDISALASRSYPERAAKILSLYLSDYSYDELLEDCKKAYCEQSFPGGAAPLCSVRDNIFSLELWHGPTAAFKDMALQIMPRLLSRALQKTGETKTALILVATSGDTGKAALEGYKDIPQVKIQVFYPSDGVSRVQKLQMATQTGKNVDVCAINGNFDDAQNGVKRIFANREMAQKLADKGFVLSSANSINWGRLAPQIAYYVSAYCDLLNTGEIRNGDLVDFCVPTGNFGNIFAAYLAKRMGLPVRKLICASNSNHILTDFFARGEYDRNRPFFLTMSPSMDILISSNLERLLYFAAGPQETAKLMEQLRSDGRYEVSTKTLESIRNDFSAYYADETETACTIKELFSNDHYLCDTHTGVAMCCACKYLAKEGAEIPLVVDSTASPYKFAADVLKSITGTSPSDPLSALDELSALSGTEIAYPLRGIGSREVRFTGSIDPSCMEDRVLAFAKND
ncbi:MAG: threonine synthase [Clostridia bacterium]|nr:threonine synthase [Clostridia bacterium]